MKIWNQHGSEHSANLVMIGHFEDVTKATKTKDIIDEITKQVLEERDNETLIVGSPSNRYSDEMRNLLMRLNVPSVGPHELEQFAYEFNVKIEKDNLILTTEELDISAFLKIMFHENARIEVYSAHDHPASSHGRGR